MSQKDIGPYPDFLVIGSMRAGSTALHDHLSHHPEIFMSHRKEPHYFSVEVDGTLPPWVSPDDKMAWRQMVVYDTEYRRLFLHGRGRLCGESSVHYLSDAESATRAARANPAMKAIALLREPAARAYSTWQFLQRMGREPLDFEDALAAESHRIKGPGYHYVGYGRYASALSVWREALGPHRVLAINHEDLSRNPGRMNATIAAFLEVDPGGMPAQVAERNTGGGVPHSLLHQRFESLIRLVVADRVPPRVAQPINRLWQRAIMTTPRPLDPVVANRIREQLLDETIELERMLGWDLSNWKPHS